MIKVKFRAKKNNALVQLAKRVKYIEQQRSEVGWFEEDGKHPSERTELSYAQLAAYHHFSDNVTNRPILHISLLQESSQGFPSIKKLLVKYFNNINGRKSLGGAKQQVNVMGKGLADKARLVFGSGLLAPNTDNTIRLKGSDKPMIETGALARALRNKTTTAER